MSRRPRKVLPTSLPQAMHLCLEHARIRHNRSVERIAELMGLEPELCHQALIDVKKEHGERMLSAMLFFPELLEAFAQAYVDRFQEAVL